MRLNLKKCGAYQALTIAESHFVVVKPSLGNTFENTMCAASTHKFCGVDGNACTAREGMTRRYRWYGECTMDFFTASGWRRTPMMCLVCKKSMQLRPVELFSSIFDGDRYNPADAETYLMAGHIRHAQLLFDE